MVELLRPDLEKTVMDGLPTGDKLARPLNPAEEEQYNDLRLGAINSAIDIQARPPGTFSYTPDTNSEVGYLKATVLGFSTTGYVTGGAKALFQENPYAHLGIDNTPDMDFSVKDFSEQDELGSMAFQDMVKSNDPLAKFYLETFRTAPNGKVASFIAQTYMAKRRELKEVADAPLFPFMMGAIGSLIVDGGMMAFTAGATAPGIGSRMAQLLRYAKTEKGGRMLAASKVGMLGGLEGGLESYAQSLTNKNMTINDILLASGLGVAAGGIIGAALPNFAGKVVTKETIDKSRRILEETVAATKAARKSAEGDSVGAAANTTDEAAIMENVSIATGGGSSIVRKIVPWNIRSPRRVVVDWSIRGAQKLREHGLIGSDRFGGMMQRLYHTSVLTDDNVAGIAQKETISMGMRLREQELFEHVDDINEMYSKFRKNILGASWWKSAISNDYLLNGLNKAVPGERGIPSLNELRLAADDWVQAKYEGDTKAMNEIMAQFKGKVPDKATGDLMDVIERIGNHDSAWYARRGQEEMDLGIIDDFDMHVPYRPQSWDTDAILGDPLGLKRILVDRFGASPDEDWINTNYKLPANPDGTPADPVRLPNESWADMAKRNPKLADEILDDWDNGRIDLNVAKIEDIKADIEREMQKFVGQTAQDVLARNGKIVKNLNNQQARAQERLEAAIKAGDIPEVGKMNKRIGELQMEARAQDNLVYELRRAQGDLARQQELVQTAGRRAVKGATKRELKKLEKEIKVQSRKSARAAARKLISERVDETVDTMSGGMAPGGFIPDDAIQTSKHFKRRTIDLSGVRHKEEWKKFLRRDSELNMDMYNDSVGRQLEIRAKFTPFLQRQGLAPDDLSPHNYKPVELLEKYLKTGYERDEIRLKDLMNTGALDAKAHAKELKALKKRGKEELFFFNRAFGELTRSDYLGNLSDNGKSMIDQMISTLQATTAASALGHVMGSQLTDVAIVAMAGGKAGTGHRC
mgnify:CR=1 FL=1